MACERWLSSLSPFLDGALPAGEREVLEAHLAGCPDCREGLDRLARVRERIRVLPSVPAPEGFRSAVMARIAEHDPAHPRSLRAPFARWAALAASFLVTGIAAAIVFYAVQPGGGRAREPAEPRGEGAAREAREAPAAARSREHRDVARGERPDRLPALEGKSVHPDAGLVRDRMEPPAEKPSGGREGRALVGFANRGSEGKGLKALERTRAGAIGKVVPAGEGEGEAGPLAFSFDPGSEHVVVVWAETDWAPPPRLARAGRPLDRFEWEEGRGPGRSTPEKRSAGKAVLAEAVSGEEGGRAARSGFLAASGKERLLLPATLPEPGAGRIWYACAVEGDPDEVNRVLSEVVRSNPRAIYDTPAPGLHFEGSPGSDASSDRERLSAGDASWRAFFDTASPGVLWHRGVEVPPRGRGEASRGLVKDRFSAARREESKKAPGAPRPPSGKRPAAVEQAGRPGAEVPALRRGKTAGSGRNREGVGRYGAAAGPRIRLVILYPARAGSGEKQDGE